MVIAVEVFWASPEDGSVRGLLAVVKGVVEALGTQLQVVVKVQVGVAGPMLAAPVGVERPL